MCRIHPSQEEEVENDKAEAEGEARHSPGTGGTSHWCPPRRLQSRSHPPMKPHQGCGESRGQDDGPAGRPERRAGVVGGAHGARACAAQPGIRRAAIQSEVGTDDGCVGGPVEEGSFGGRAVERCGCARDVADALETGQGKACGMWGLGRSAAGIDAAVAACGNDSLVLAAPGSNSVVADGVPVAPDD
ncbi:hypothetical protein Naga_100322g6 [Nannochloropsis gaditana]|uniref:Uncharacterized protein n=1 Tax=Nannochloropsis gaditana TaxID=72520 RepID=W7TFB6_9STRA|nr:hypothetical protein Naga_100322g6 [Nannochloropsis gaditana]EWM24847.1 hypothetical protein Naga_100322g6 [Nannochloropsis gaditana]